MRSRGGAVLLMRSRGGAVRIMRSRGGAAAASIIAQQRRRVANTIAQQRRTLTPSRNSAVAA
ncbi:hypothetical protein [Adlercreutzia sp. ZJ154]|uniref:hypothetical protein n=1 Tax=Adlercreutzia sp. ZJ154 TaxID=2709790 RepID=UPI0013EA8620|nr:hypothetical protein [Adlercreutzia sp. ZJ154]